MSPGSFIFAFVLLFFFSVVMDTVEKEVNNNIGFGPSDYQCTTSQERYCFMLTYTGILEEGLFNQNRWLLCSGNIRICSNK